MKRNKRNNWDIFIADEENDFTSSGIYSTQELVTIHD